MTQGYVYILEGDGVYKIGKATTVDRRVKQITPKLPFKVEVLGIIWSGDPHTLEKKLHKQFAASRKEGEWFELTTLDLLDIQKEHDVMSWGQYLERRELDAVFQEMESLEYQLISMAGGDAHEVRGILYRWRELADKFDNHPIRKALDPEVARVFEEFME